jgi:hypothetical protein
MKEIYTSLAKAQSVMGKASKDSTNPHFRSKYADLASCTDAIRSAIGEFGLAYIQVCHDADKAACVETIITHESGQHISCGKVSVPVNKLDAQGYGSALTYARRYSLSAAFGLASEDDDGNHATQAVPRDKPRQNTVEHEPAFDADIALADIRNLPIDEAKDIARSIWKKLSKADQEKAKAIIAEREAAQ